MLDYMRKHSEGWFIKVLLGLIALVFVVYFAGSAAGPQLGAQTAAIVGEQAIPLQQYNVAYDAAVDRVRDQFKEGLPDNFAKFLRSNILQQLIERKVTSAFAHSLGFQIADSEVAQMIRKQKQFYKDGVFNTRYYRKEFRPFYRRRFGTDFETALREDLLLDLYSSFQLTGILSAPDENQWSTKVAQSEWEFEVIEVPKKEGLSDEEIEAKLTEWLNKWSRGPIAKSELDTLEAKLRDKTRLSFLERDKILGRRLPDAHVKSLFAIREANTVYPQSIRIGSKWYLVKVNSYSENKKEPDSEQLMSRLNNDFFTIWLDDFRKQLQIKTNVSL